MHPSIKRSLALGLGTYGSLVHSSPVSMQQMRNANPANIATRNLFEKRSVTNIACGLFSSADVDDTSENIANLKNKGGNAAVPANSCSRVGCYNTSGAYVCNDQDSDISVPLSEVSNVLNFITSTCIGSNEAESGQAFVDTYGGYNVVVAYCNGNLSPSTPPDAYTPPGMAIAHIVLVH